MRLMKLLWFLVTLGPVRRILRRTLLFRAIRFVFWSVIAVGVVVTVAVIARRILGPRPTTAPEEQLPRAVEASQPAVAPRPVAPQPVAPQPGDDASQNEKVDSADGSCPDSHPVKGVARSGIFHDSSSRWYASAKADVCFTDAAAAERAGFRPPGGRRA